MRRILLVAVLAIGALAATACEPSEPSMTISAAVTDSCANVISGNVTPAAATAKVVLQRTVGGKWVDFKWYKTSDSDESPAVITAPVNKPNGNYSLRFTDSSYYGKLKGTVHFRVRSNGGGYTSKGLYVTYPHCG